MKLKEVRISYADSCVTYALKRIGVDPYENKLVTSSALLSCKLFDKMDFDKELLRKGDLGFWDRDEMDLAANVITEDGIVLSERVYVSRHVAVWEGAFWSNLKGLDKVHPFIALEKELRRPPDYILRLK